MIRPTGTTPEITRDESKLHTKYTSCAACEFQEPTRQRARINETAHHSWRRAPGRRDTLSQWEWPVPGARGGRTGNESVL